MSVTYEIVEDVAFFLNHHVNGCVKKIMHNFITSSSNCEELPLWIYLQLKVKKYRYKDFPIYVMRRKNNINAKKAILFLAGGGGMARPMFLHFDIVSKLARDTGATVYFAYYPLAPEHNVIQALEWLEGVYRRIVNKHLVEDITIMGDSAGANLTLSLINRVKNKPSKAILVSPASGLEYGRNRDIRLAVEHRDPLLTVKMNDLIAENWARNVPLSSPDISPEYICYKGFPRILLFCGTHEVFYPHNKKLISKMKKEGAKAETVIMPMCHDWALCRVFPEGKNAVIKMSDFISM